MAGLLLHLAMGDPNKMNPDNKEYSVSFKKSYALGLLLPDIAKQHYIGSSQGYVSFFQGCLPEDIMTYNEYLQFGRTHHFNPDKTNPAQQDTRDPNLKAFLNTRYVDLNKPLWQGVFCHLMGDKAFYYKSYCVDDNRAMKDYAEETGPIGEWDADQWRASSTGKIYYDDYDVLNKCIEDEYGVLNQISHYFDSSFLQELLDSFHVKFSSERKAPVYMNLNNIRKYIDFSRILNQDIEQGGGSERVLDFFDGNHLDELYKT